MPTGLRLWSGPRGRRSRQSEHDRPRAGVPVERALAPAHIAQSCRTGTDLGATVQTVVGRPEPNPKLRRATPAPMVEWIGRESAR